MEISRIKEKFKITQDEKRALIARKIMGWKLETDPPTSFQFEEGDIPLPAWLEKNENGNWVWTGFLTVEPKMVYDEGGGYGMHQEPSIYLGDTMWCPDIVRDQLAMVEEKLSVEQWDIYLDELQASLGHPSWFDNKYSSWKDIRQASPAICTACLIRMLKVQEKNEL